MQLSLLYAQTRQLNRALEMIDAAIRLRPDDSDLSRRRLRLLRRRRYGRVAALLLNALGIGYDRWLRRLVDRLSPCAAHRRADPQADAGSAAHAPTGHPCRRVNILRNPGWACPSLTRNDNDPSETV